MSRLILTAIGGMLAILTLLALMAPSLAPDKYWAPLFAAYGFVYLFMAQALLLAIWLIRPGKGMWITVIALLFCLPSLGRHLQFGGTPDGEPGSIQLATLNVYALRNLWKAKTKTHKLDRTKTADLFPKDRQPDILCLQEVPRAYSPDGMDWGMSKAYIHRYKNTLIFSRYRFLKTGEKSFEQSGNSIIWADIETPNGKVRIYNAHLQSHSITKDTEDLLDAQIDNKDTWKGYRSVLGRVKRSTAKRAGQARWLAEEIASCSIPVLVLGDFNDTPQSFCYRTVAEGLEDSFRCGGTGFGTTFAGKIPGLRIDYILGGKGLHFLDHQVHRGELSDHYPVSARFVFDEKPASPKE